jgi:glycopeptide antibiotics resistance protein
VAKRIAFIYVAVVLGLTLLPVFGVDRQAPIEVHLEPFRTIRNALASGIGSRDFALFLGNIAIFMPLGVLLPILSGRRQILLVFGVAVAFSGGIEVSQFILSELLGFGYRIADVDDVIVNVTGALLGYAVLRVFEIWQRASARRQRSASLEETKE